MRISDWSSDVCSSDLGTAEIGAQPIPVVADENGRFDDQHMLALPLFVEDVGEVGKARVEAHHMPFAQEIGRASCRARACKYVQISVVAVPLKKKNTSSV